jgi:hypothetical protein
MGGIAARDAEAVPVPIDDIAPQPGFAEVGHRFRQTESRV